MPNHSTPMGLAAVLFMCDQDCVQVPGAKPWLVATGGLLGLAALARSVAVAFLPFIALWLWWAVRRAVSVPIP